MLKFETVLCHLVIKSLLLRDQKREMKHKILTTMKSD